MAPDDPKEKFYRRFQGEVIVLQEQIDNLASLSTVGGERQDAIDAVLAAISRLSNEVSDASDYVPAYDQRTYSQAIKSLTDRLNQTTTKLAPRSKFQFKARAPKPATDPAAAGSIPAPPTSDPRILTNPNTNPIDRPGSSPARSPQPSEATDNVGDLPTNVGGTSATRKNYNEEMAQPSDTHVRKPSFSAAREIAISGHAGLHIILPPTASHATSSGRLTDIRSSVVDMSLATSNPGGSSHRGNAAHTPFANLALRDIENCLVVAGSVSGPAHVTNVRKSILVVAARQVRMHECKDVDVYLYCSSHPIIEDCEGVRVAPLPPIFTTPDDPAKNQWNQVDDFKWLKTEASPNWSVLPEKERLPEEVWTKTVPGEPGKDHNDILKAVGIEGRLKSV